MYLNEHGQFKCQERLAAKLALMIKLENDPIDCRQLLLGNFSLVPIRSRKYGLNPVICRHSKKEALFYEYDVDVRTMITEKPLSLKDEGK